MGAGQRWLLCSVLVGACVANDRSTRPPLVPPAPPQDVISVAGFDDAMHLGSDYIYSSKLPDRVFLGSQEMPGNLWLLRFGPGPTGGPPVDLVIDLNTGSVREVQGAYGSLRPPDGQPPPSLSPPLPSDKPSQPPADTSSVRPIDTPGVPPK